MKTTILIGRCKLLGLNPRQLLLLPFSDLQLHLRRRHLQIMLSALRSPQFQITCLRFAARIEVLGVVFVEEIALLENSVNFYASCGHHGLWSDESVFYDGIDIAYGLIYFLIGKTAVLIINKNPPHPPRRFAPFTTRALILHAVLLYLACKLTVIFWANHLAIEQNITVQDGFLDREGARIACLGVKCFLIPTQIRRHDIPLITNRILTHIINLGCICQYRFHVLDAISKRANILIAV